MLSNMKDCLNTFLNTEKRVENTIHSRVLFINNKVSGNVLKHGVARSCQSMIVIIIVAFS